MDQVEHVLLVRYLRGTTLRQALKGLTSGWSDPGAEQRNVLMGWVDSDFAADPDTRRSVRFTGYAVSLSNVACQWNSEG
eukprot:2786895-Rhodomonas_salina.2